MPSTPDLSAAQSIDRRESQDQEVISVAKFGFKHASNTTRILRKALEDSCHWRRTQSASKQRG